MAIKKYVVILLFCCCLPELVWAGQPIVDSGVNSDSIVVADTLIRTRAVGRFDRGITNHRFAPRKQWMGGITVSYANFDSRDSRLLVSLIKDLNCEGYTMRINPFFGYFVRDNVAIGFKLGYERSKIDLGNLSLKFDDVDISLKDIYLMEKLVSGTFFHRSYVGLDAGKRIGLFNETSLSVTIGSSRFQRGTEENLKDTRTHIQEIQLGLNPGLAVFIMENISTEFSFGILGIKYRKESQKTNGEETGSWRSSGANFKINIFNINIGLTVYI